ncbi:unnamed protein product [Mycena citricolor]|uniref:Uncharacterized protein n=1 Tax=Mycena citricolor TaxID=2018698 RepID=A0AAD2Q3A2_9AGAR|nr:unnamed protein product [Mycena citricolor]
MTDILTDMGLYATDSNVIAWEEKDRRALSAIRLRVADGPLIYITDAVTSKSAWDTLMDTYKVDQMGHGLF